MLYFVIVIAAASSAALCLHAQEAAGATATPRVSATPTPTATPTATATPTPVVSTTPTPVVSATPTANQTGSGADPTLVGAAIVGIIAVGLMVGFYYTTRRM